jgi:hypothetical protein
MEWCVFPEGISSVNFKSIAKCTSVACGIGLILTIASIKLNKPRHAVTFRLIEEYTQRDPLVAVSLDGNDIGLSPEAFYKLAKIPITQKDIIRVDLTDYPASKPPKQRLYFEAGFIQEWLHAGARINYFRNHKKIEVHTITWSNFDPPLDEYKHDMDDIHFFVDGITFENGRDFMDYMNHVRWPSNSLVQILTPIRWIGAIDDSHSDTARYLSDLHQRFSVEYYDTDSWH